MAGGSWARCGVGGSPLSLPVCMVAARTSRRGASAVGAVGRRLRGAEAKVGGSGCHAMWGSGMAASLLALWDGSWAQWVLAWDVGAAGPGEGPGGAGGDAPSVSLARHGWTYGSRGCSPTRLPLATQPPTD